MPKRFPMSSEGVFHIFNKSIAGYQIFQTPHDFQRFIWMMQYYSLPKQQRTFSHFFRDYAQDTNAQLKLLLKKYSQKIQLIAYCLMPTHFHLVAHQRSEGLLSHFMTSLQGAYSQYFNMKHKRKGPLWESRFEHVECLSDEQLFHLTRYVHLNPVTAYLVNQPEDWIYSSYREYIGLNSEKICHPQPFISWSAEIYKKFVVDQIQHQRTLAVIKQMLQNPHTSGRCVGLSRS